MNKNNRIIVEKMQAAYDEFARQMAVLEKRADALVKKALKEIDREKIAATLKNIKEIS